MLVFLNYIDNSEQTKEYVNNLIYELSRLMQKSSKIKEWKPHKSLTKLTNKIELFVKENNLKLNQYGINIQKNLGLYKTCLKIWIFMLKTKTKSLDF